ncbi:cupin domain-containing protein [Pseudonocardia sichuanensis]
MTTKRFRSEDDPDLDDLYSDLAAADLQPLWLQQGLLPRRPNRLRAHVWRWKTLRALAERSGDLVGIDRGGDRRVLALTHPDLGGLPFATHTLWGAIQYLNAGELAPAHRHSPAALRFVLEGSGVWTLVNGDAVLMEPGDLVLTPSYNWHEHHNPGSAPMLWFDGLDLPLVRNLDAVFFEEGPEELSPYEPLRTSRSEQHLGNAGLQPVGYVSPIEPPASGQGSPLLAYRWAQTDWTLAALLAGAQGGAAAVRYVDPTSGKDIMPTLRGEMHRLLPGYRTPTTRTAGSGIWVVHRGSGASVIDGVRHPWSAGDVFVTPSWAPVDHAAVEPADLFLLSDAPVLEALGLGRTEVLPEHQEVVGAAAG